MQPKALYLLFFVKMWECFSFYGMRALMVLYLINQLGVEDERAYGIYAVYCALVESSALVGGRLADRFLGLKKAVVYGGWLIAAGHTYLAFYDTQESFYVALALIVAGSGLFSTNISALLGLFYEEDDPSREAGFTFFYVGINVGALLASVVCVFVSEQYGWHYGFFLAALGMVLGNLLFLCSARLLAGKGERTYKGQSFWWLYVVLFVPLAAALIAWEHVTLKLLPFVAIGYGLYIGRKMVQSKRFLHDKLMLFGLYLVALAILFAAEDQTASALLVFSQRHATDSIWGIPIPVATLLSINPFVIITGGLLLAKYRVCSNISRSVRFALMLTTSVFLLLAVACHYPNSQGLVPLEVVALAMVVISLGELILTPALFSYCIELAPKEWLGATMGLLPVGFSLGNLLSGLLSKAIVVENSPRALASYEQNFALVAVAVGIWICLHKFMQGRTSKKVCKVLASMQYE